MFKKNLCLFRTVTLGGLIDCRDMESDFGILPIPKLYEGQDGYYCLVSCWDSPMVIPITVGNQERTGLIAEALFWQSRGSLRYAFYDKLLSGKLVRDEESVQMLSLIVDSKGFDFDWAAEITSVFSILSGIAASKDGSALSSRLASIRNGAEKKLNFFVGNLEKIS